MTKRIGERVIFQTKFFTIKDIDLQFDDKKVTYQIMEKPDSVIIVPITNDGQLILIKEYMPAIDKYLIDIPGGRIDIHTPEEAANKELQEEIGYKANKLDLLGIVSLSPGYLTQKTYLFLARNLMESKLEGDEVEKIETIKYPFEKFEELINQGKITEARAITALYLTKKVLSEEGNQQ